MQKMKKNKKGFTLTELAIVIAVIAILVAVLVPTFISLINKAEVSADKQTVKNLNTALTTEESISGEQPQTMSEALAVAENYGYNVSNLTPTSSGNIIWDQVNNRFILVDENNKVLLADSRSDVSEGDTITPYYTYWCIIDSESEYNTYNTGYSLYINTTLDTVASSGGVEYAEGCESANTSVTATIKTSQASTSKATASTAIKAASTIDSSVPQIIVKTNGGDFTANVSGAVVNHTGTIKDLHLDGETPYAQNVTITGDTYLESEKVNFMPGGTDSITFKISESVTESGVETILNMLAENCKDCKISVGSESSTIATQLSNLASNYTENSNMEIVTSATSSYFDGGLGTENSPYQIATAAQFKNIGTLSSKMLSGNAYYFLLMDDIDLSSYNNTAFTTYFCGELDGDNHSVYMGQCNVISSGTIYDVTIKNLTIVQTGTYFSPIFNYINAYPSGSNLYVGREGTVTFENINFESNFSGTHITPNYGYSQFCCWAYGKINFIDCTNYVSYSISSSTYSYGAYAGLFIGNYISQGKGSTVSYINCVNYGTVSGDHVGFLFGNSSQASGGVILVDSSDYENTDTSHAAIYISGCANYGTLMGTAKVELAMSLGTLTVNDDVNASLMSDSTKFYNAGLMITSNVDDMSLSLNSDNQVVITGSNDSQVASYTVTCGVSIGFKRNDGSSAGSWYFAISETVTDVSSVKINYITKVMLNTDYDSTVAEGSTYTDLAKAGTLTSDQGIEYILVEQSDGSYIAVINSDSAMSMFGNGSVSMSCGATPNYRIICNNSNGVSIGGVNYTISELEATKAE